jgi:hypothetical protein
VDKLVKEAKRVLGDAADVVAAHDLMVIHVPRRGGGRRGVKAQDVQGTDGEVEGSDQARDAFQ